MPIYKAEYLPNYRMPNGKVIIGQTAAVPEIKSAQELKEAVDELKKMGFNVEWDLVSGVSHSECLRLKNTHHIEFDNMYQGHHGMAGLEAISLGIPTLAYLRPEMVEAYKKLGNGEEVPFINVRNKDEIVSVLAKFLGDRKAWQEWSHYCRSWIEKYYNEERLVKMYAALYEDLAGGNG